MGGATADQVGKKIAGSCKMADGGLGGATADQKRIAGAAGGKKERRVVWLGLLIRTSR